MRLISKFKDYYDNASPYDTDPKRVFVRHTRELDAEDFPTLKTLLDDMPWFEKLSTSWQPVGVVAFCGKAYPYYRFEWYGSSVNFFSDINKDITYCYSLEAVVKYWKSILKEAIASENRKPQFVAKDVLNKLTDPKDYYGSQQKPSCLTALSEATWKRYKKTTNFELSDELFLKADSPILHMFVGGGGYQMEANPRLNCVGFANVMDSYSAYQELEMFVGTNLVKQMDPNVYVSDVIKAESHGFNKFSFRKDPSKKGKRRKSR